jgi:UDP-N-acetylmuramate--alanine ligase
MNAAIPRHVHLVGIGGMHMSAIARILLTWGHEVSGSDQRRSLMTDAIEKEGARVFIGHAAENVGDAGLVVTTSAAPGSNPELLEAETRGIPLIKRAEMVARLMEGRRGICIAGSHGKSTTSGLVAFLLRECGRDPTYLIGAEIAALGTNAAAGNGPDVVVEADEYDRAFLSYHPEIAAVLNVEPDHLDYYKTEAAMREAFGDFVANVASGGTALLCADAPGAMELRTRAGPDRTITTFALENSANWHAVLPEGPPLGTTQQFHVLIDGTSFGDFEIALAGRHMVSNALAAIAIGAAVGLTPAEMRAPLARYTGVRRRFEPVGEVAGITLMDDYAHHPTEVAALAQAARMRFPGRRIVALFQPHTFARTRYLLAGWRICFEGFDRLFLLETYAAREAIADGMTAAQLADEVTSPRPTYCPDPESAAATVAADLKPGDVFFTVGAGDVDAVGRMVLVLLNGATA